MRPHPVTTPRARRYTRQAALETLEKRQLLTRIASGILPTGEFFRETLVYQETGGRLARIHIENGGEFEVIGTSVAVDGTTLIHDLPATILREYDSNRDGNYSGDGDRPADRRDVLGGFGGADGIELIGTVTGDFHNSRPVITNNGQPVPAGTQVINFGAQMNFDALAANNRGRVYAINTSVSDDTPIIELLNLGNYDPLGQRLFDITSDIVTQVSLSFAPDPDPDVTEDDFTAEDINRVIGADFLPSDDNTLYFAVEIELPVPSGGGWRDQTVPALFTYSLVDNSIALVPGYFGHSLSQDEIMDISDFTFDDEDRMILFATVNPTGQDTPAVTGLFRTDPADPRLDVLEITDYDDPSTVTGFIAGVRLQTGAATFTAVQAVDAMEYIPGTGRVFLVPGDEGGAGQGGILSVILPQGDNPPYEATLLGNIIDPDDNRQTPRGTNISDITWNARMRDTFFVPGSRGVLMGFDSVTDETVGIDIRERFPVSSIYAIYGFNTTAATTYVTSIVLPPQNTNIPLVEQALGGNLDPFNTTAGSIQINRPANPTAPIFSLGQTGGLYLGQRTTGINNTPDVVPVLSLSTDSREDGGNFAGTRIASLNLPAQLVPGVYIDGPMRNFFYAGTITGNVVINGSVDTFYAGNILTGNAAGGFFSTPENFTVRGDLRNLIAQGIGTFPGAPSALDDGYDSGADFAINGRVGQIKSANDLRARFNVLGAQDYSPSGFSLDFDLNEQENLLPNSATLQRQIGNAFQAFQIANQPWIRNDTFDTPQILGAYNSGSRGTTNQVRIDGVISRNPNNGLVDPEDYYAVPMMAGQTFTVQMTDVGLQGIPLQFLYVSVVDPEGRVYATDLEALDLDATLEKTMSITADKPGLWRIAVRIRPTVGGLFANYAYSLTVEQLGNLSVGGLVSFGDTWFRSIGGNSVRVRGGDLGAIYSVGAIQGADFATLVGANELAGVNPILVEGANLRVIDGSRIGLIDNNSPVLVPNLFVPGGSIGRISSDSYLLLNRSFRNPLTDEPYNGVAVGGDIQVVDAQGELGANLIANGGIGLIRAGAVWTSTAAEFTGYWQVDADDEGDDGYIDLIDVTGDFGSFIFGGPAMRTGTNGNIRYLRIGGTAYRDRFFGRGVINAITGVDETVVLFDDSGTRIQITPVLGAIDNGTPVFNPPTNPTLPGAGGFDPTNPFNPPLTGAATINPFAPPGSVVPNPFQPIVPTIPNPSDPNNPIVVGGQVEILAYPVRSGGVVIYQVSVEDYSLAISTSSDADNARAEIGQINLTDNEDGQPSGLRKGITIGGVPTDVLEVRVIDGRSGPTPLSIDSIVNSTTGELVNVIAADVGRLEAEQIGLATGRGPTAVEGSAVVTDGRFAFIPGAIANSYPFNQAKNMVRLGNVTQILARRSLGNIAVVGTASNIVANSDNSGITGVFEGVAGPIVVGTELNRLEIGEGLLFSGSGDVGFSGVFVDGIIGGITNLFGNGDIRGDILFGTNLGSIALTNGSMIGGDLFQTGFGVRLPGMAVSPAVVASPFHQGIEDESFIINLPSGASVQTIDSITINGGGIIGVESSALGYGLIRITNGFGVINSEFSSPANATMQGIITDGYGIRGTVYQGGGFIETITAIGSGELISTRNFQKNVLYSEKFLINPFTGIENNRLTDLHKALGTSRGSPVIPTISLAGVIEDSQIQASRRLGNVTAYQIRGGPAAAVSGLSALDESYPMRLSGGNEITSITVGDDVNGARVTAGVVNSVTVGRDTIYLIVDASSLVGTVSIGRNMRGTTDIRADGPGGRVNSVTAGGFMNGTIVGSVNIGSVTAGRNLGTHYLRSFGTIGSINVGGSVIGGAFIRATKSIASITIAGDVQFGATIRAKAISAQTIGGTVFGDIVIS